MPAALCSERQYTQPNRSSAGVVLGQPDDKQFLLPWSESFPGARRGLQRGALARPTGGRDDPGGLLVSEDRREVTVSEPAGVRAHLERVIDLLAGCGASRDRPLRPSSFACATPRRRPPASATPPRPAPISTTPAPQRFAPWAGAPPPPPAAAGNAHQRSTGGPASSARGARPPSAGPGRRRERRRVPSVRDQTR